MHHTSKYVRTAGSFLSTECRTYSSEMTTIRYSRFIFLTIDCWCDINYKQLYKKFCTVLLTMQKDKMFTKELENNRNDGICNILSRLMKGALITVNTMISGYVFLNLCVLLQRQFITPSVTRTFIMR